MRWDVINALLIRCDRRLFLEIGVLAGDCSRRVEAAKIKWGVGPDPVHGADLAYFRFFQMTSDGTPSCPPLAKQCVKISRAVVSVRSHPRTLN
jgi:hypothetical protein